MKTKLIQIGIPGILMVLAGSALAQDAVQSAAPGGWLEGVAAGLNAWLHEAGEDELSAMGMFMAADWVVKAVMISLAFASVLTWLIFFAKTADLLWQRSRLKRGFRRMDAHATLAGSTSIFKHSKGVVGRMVDAAVRERDRSVSASLDKAGIKERVSSELTRIEAGAARSMMSGTGILANIGSTAPFVGLFGTVWGIMNSFISISESNTTNLAVVAPGIAEAPERRSDRREHADSPAIALWRLQADDRDDAGRCRGRASSGHCRAISILQSKLPGVWR